MKPEEETTLFLLSEQLLNNYWPTERRSTYYDLYFEFTAVQVVLVVDVHALESVLASIQVGLDEKDDGEAALGNDLLNIHGMLAQLKLFANEMGVRLADVGSC